MPMAHEKARRAKMPRSAYIINHHVSRVARVKTRLVLKRAWRSLSWLRVRRIHVAAACRVWSAPT